MKKVLITDADGFIASHLTDMFVAQEYKVKALSQYNSFNNWGWLENINRKIDWISKPEHLKMYKSEIYNV